MVEPVTESSSVTDSGFEPRINARAVILTGVVVLGVVTAVVVGVFLIRGTFPVTQVTAPVPPRPLSATESLPGLQTHPQADLRAFNRDKQRRLHSYGWVDKAHGIVHIPIERAMEMMTQREVRR